MATRATFRVQRTTDLPDGVLYAVARSTRDNIGVMLIHADHITEDCARAMEAAWYEMVKHYQPVAPPLRSVGA